MHYYTEKLHNRVSFSEYIDNKRLQNIKRILRKFH